ncbi:GNAT family N-acetyltransferase [Lysinibacillus sp. LZ02]|uniref:GNAT family N-acetyltransferase n=1 Tax=Lysinibacillus sp. LZ02 TaxID=3420668 RepID=UPI003D36846B
MLKSLFNLFRKKGDRSVKLDGEKCFLRTFGESDARELAMLLSNNKHFWSTYEPIHREDYYTEEAQYKKILEGLQLLALNREFSFGIYEKDSEKLIGHISLYAIKRMPYSSAFVGYSMDQHFVGRGIATEAVKLVVELAFASLKLHRVEAYIAPENISSIRVIEKAGFAREGLLRKLLFINGEWVDHYMYAMLQEEYLQKKV